MPLDSSTTPEIAMQLTEEREVFPIQTPGRYGDQATVPKQVYMAAYEVYSKVFAPQEAMITEDCRGGFSTGEMMAFLYARAFPKAEWRTRVDEAFRGMKNA